MIFYDAHNHLHDERLEPHRVAALATLARLRVGGAVVNGTREADWPAVAALAAGHPWVIPAFGLHPWHIAARSAQWLENLTRQLDAHPTAGVGEIGLDRWVEGHDLAMQTDVFTAQLALAAARGLPVSIHCLKAWGPLWEILRAYRLPACGFLLHSYGGPPEMLSSFAARGGYFSFSAYFLHERKAAQRETFRHVPLDRLLVETDAPDMAPPTERNAHPLLDAATGRAINHPANLALAYAGLAEVRGMDVEALTAQVAENFARLFPLPTRVKSSDLTDGHPAR